MKPEKKRIVLTQVLSLPLLALPWVSQSAWTAGGRVMLAEIMFLSGVMLISIGMLGRAWCLSYIAGHKSKKLIQSGPYSLCRNPLYFFSFIGALGVGLSTRTFIIPALLALGFGLYYPSVIRGEARKLREIFGAEMDAYIERVPAFFPSFRGFVEAEEVVISGRAFRKNAVYLVFFMVPVVYFGVLDALHRVGSLPVWFRVY